MNDTKQPIRRRLLTANFSTVLSVALVLFMVACILLFSFHAWYFTSQIKEEVSFTVYMADGSMVADGQQLTKTLQSDKMVKSARYISTEEATQMMDEVMGKGHLDVLEGFNPYQASIEVHLKSENFSVAQIKQFITTLEAKPTVEMVDYRDDLINNINSELYDASAFVIIILIALLIISITLINHTINLTISSKKLLIRSMQLVGAKSSFIRRPFIIKGLWIGLFSGLLADLFAAALLIWIYTLLKGFDFQVFYPFYILVAVGIVILGVLLSFVFSYIAVIRNMNLRNYKLYN